MVHRCSPWHHGVGRIVRLRSEGALERRCPLVNVRLRLQRLLLPVLLVCRDAQIHAPAQGVCVLPQVVDALFFSWNSALIRSAEILAFKDFEAWETELPALETLSCGCIISET